MFDDYFPDGYAGSVYDIDFGKLYAMGIRGLILDIDNTLVHHGDDVTTEARELIAHIRSTGLAAVLLSDNDENRVRRFVDNMDIPYVCDAEKPGAAGYEKALALLGTKKKETVAIGDQMFADIAGANRFGVSSILVHYISLPGEKWPGFKRLIEKAMLIIYRYGMRDRHKLDAAVKEAR